MRLLSLSVVLSVSVVGALACSEPPEADEADAAVADAGAVDAVGVVCGDGVAEVGEACDDGNDDNGDICANDCTLNVDTLHDITIKWWFNREAALGFDGDACYDVGVDQVQVELRLLSQPSLRYLRTEACALRQARFLGVPVGDYEARLRPLDADDVLKTEGEIRRTVAVAPPLEIIDVDVHPDDWSDSYTGTFFFRLRWGNPEGVDCAEAVPAVTQHVLLLEQNGVAATQTTDVGDSLDGTTPGACRSVAEPLPQVVEGLALGPARFTVVGRDKTGIETHRSAFDTFIGAGVSNPEFKFDVAAITPAE